MLSSEDWRSMVSDGKDDAHKLFGVDGSNLSSSNICKESQWIINTTAFRQYHSSSIYQHLGGTMSKQLVSLSKDLWMFPQLAIWHISGRDIIVKNVWRMLLHSCLNHRDQKLTNLTTHSLGYGVAGVVNKVPI